jgi:hypothetical protein
MRDRPSPPDEHATHTSAASAFGMQPRGARPRKRGRTLADAGIFLALALVTLLLVATGPPRSRATHRSSGLPACDDGFDTPRAREGECDWTEGSGPATVYNVVDRGRVLRMPEYDARLLTSTVVRTPITDPSVNPGAYPHAHGLLVSYELAVTNPGDRALELGAVDSRWPSYPNRPQTELLIPPSRASSASGSREVIPLDELVNGRGAPRPSIGQRRLIAAHTTVTVWATFIAPEWSRALLSARPADIDFLRSEEDSRYIGQIRLWR